MTVSEKQSGSLRSLWRDPAASSTTCDVFAILVVVSLPWSTTLVAIFAAAFLLAVLPHLDWKAFLQLLKRPISTLPTALFVLALAGMLWSNASWAERLHALGPFAKLLLLPLLVYHFERSARGVQVLIAFLVSCLLLMLMSWIVAFDPKLALRADPEYGVPVRNYIDQSQEFALCAVLLAYPVITLWRAKKIVWAMLLAAISFSFTANMIFVTISRTALVTMPIMVGVFAMVHLKWRSIILIACATGFLGALAWTTSPKLRATAAKFSTEYTLYSEQNSRTSIGLRLVFWQKSLSFFSQAPLFGHGTGSIRGLFENAAVGQAGAAAEVIANPHNQTLGVAVQWGAVGVAILYAMWLVHLLAFRGDGLPSWVGMMVVLQNMLTSLFNSHLVDFTAGWMYVFGVGISAGMLRSLERSPKHLGWESDPPQLPNSRAVQ